MRVHVWGSDDPVQMLPPDVPVPQAPPPLPPPPAPTAPRIQTFAPSLGGALAQLGQPPASDRARGKLDLSLRSAADSIRQDMRPDATVQGNAGKDWMSEVRAWVEQRKYYPSEAIAAGEQGSVTISIEVARDGRVLSVRMVNPSRSVYLNMAWLGMFQGKTLPPFRPDATDPTANIVFTMHYYLRH